MNPASAEQASARRHDLVAVFPTLTILNLTLTPHLNVLGPVART